MFVFAATASIARATIIASGLESPIAETIRPTLFLLDVVGVVLAYMALPMLSGWQPEHWAWDCATLFAGSLVQGLLYAWLGLALYRRWTANKSPRARRALVAVAAGPGLSALAAWFMLLGRFDPDYSVAQVAGLVLTLVGIAAAIGWWVAGPDAWLGHLSVVAGVSAACYLDWSDDVTGLFMVGWTMVTIGTLTGTALVIRGAAALRSS